MTEVLDNQPDPLDAVVEDFLSRRRAGESPSAEEYARRYPELAPRIRALFPTLLLLEGGPTPTAAPAAPQQGGGGEVPATLGPFRILREVGRGGMGVVYEAVQEPLGRRVALKVLPPEYARRPGFRARFQREAAAAARLHHTNIVPVFASGECEGTLYFAMQFIDGRTATAWRAAPAGRAREVARLGLQAAEALAYAHAHGVLHRDVKPANLLVDEAGTLWVADFGLAKAQGADDLTGSGELLGTLRYLAPERFAGRCDSRSDVYALGVTLYELLALRSAFDEADRLKLVQQIGAGAGRLRRWAAWVPADLETVVHKALAVEPAGRYQTARELAEDLRRFLDDQPVRARRLGPVGRLVRWARRRPAVAALLGLVALVSAAGLGGVLWAYGQARDEAENARHEQQRANDKAAEALQKEKEARLQAYLAQVGRVDAQLQAQDHPGALLVLDRLGPEYRGWEYGYLRRRAEGTPLNLRGHAKGATCVCFSPDGTRLASASADHTVKVWDAQSGAEVFTLRGHTGIVWSVSFSPDGRRLASASEDKTVKLWDARSGTEVATLRGHADQVYSVCHSPDGSCLASAGQDRTVKVWDIRSGTEIATLRGHADQVRCVAFSPDGRRLASASWDNTLKVWDVRRGTEVLTLRNSPFVYSVCYSPDGSRLASYSEDTIQVWDAHRGSKVATVRVRGRGVMSVVYSPDGSRLAEADIDNTVKVWDAHSGAAVATLRGHTGTVWSVCYSPDGSRLASASADAMVKVWDARSGPDVMTLRGHVGQVNSVSYSPDGSRIASGAWEQAVKIWDAGSGTEVATLRGHGGQVYSVCYSPDGLHLASGSHDKTVKVWDARSGAEVATLRGHAREVRSVCYSPDGTRIASASDDNTVKLWDAHSGAEVATLRGHAREVTAVCYSPDGRSLASASWDQTVKVWDAKSGAETRTLGVHTSLLLGVCYSPDGTRLATASADNIIKVWDAASGTEVFTLRGHTASVWSVAYSPDGTRLASASQDGTIKLWDVASGAEVATLRGRVLDEVYSVCYSPDGSCLASAGGDRTVQVWDARHGTEVATFRGHAAEVRSVGYNPEGTHIIATDAAGKPLVWDIASGTLLSGAEPPRQLPVDNVSPDGQFVAVPLGTDVRIFRRRPLPGSYDPWAEDARRRHVQAPPWHAEQAEAARKRGDAFAAAFHGRCLSEGDNLRLLAWARLAAGDTDGCRQALQQLRNEQDQITTSWPLSGALASGLTLRPTPAVTTGPVAAVALARREKLRRAAVLVRAAALLPDSGIAPAELLKLAHTCAEADPQSWQCRELLGAALCRDGQATAALEQLKAAVRRHGAGGSLWARLFLALAHHRLGQAQQARQWRGTAERADAWEEAVVRRQLLAELDAPVRAAKP
jgi:WD40 repeat protein